MGVLFAVITLVYAGLVFNCLFANIHCYGVPQQAAVVICTLWFGFGLVVVVAIRSLGSPIVGCRGRRFSSVRLLAHTRGRLYWAPPKLLPGRSCNVPAQKNPKKSQISSRSP